MKTAQMLLELDNKCSLLGEIIRVKKDIKGEYLYWEWDKGDKQISFYFDEESCFDPWVENFDMAILNFNLNNLEFDAYLDELAELEYKAQMKRRADKDVIEREKMILEEEQEFQFYLELREKYEDRLEDI